MPGQNEEVVRSAGMGFRLGDDGNVGAGCNAAELLRIHLRNAGQPRGGEATELEDHIALRGRAVAKDGGALAGEFVE